LHLDPKKQIAISSLKSPFLSPENSRSLRIPPHPPPSQKNRLCRGVHYLLLDKGVG
jgi:hypothetical protein